MKPRSSDSDSGKSTTKVSTSRLAKLAGIDSRQLFERLLQRQWLIRETLAEGKSQYRLTGKGEFEGGEYQQSDKFGRYIVWPQTLLQHNVLQGLQQPLLTATALGKALHCPGRVVNLLLADLGWIEPVASGWQLSDAGKALGGSQKETEQGATYAAWPESMLQHPAWQQSIAQMDPDNRQRSALDGRLCDTPGERLIINWLYLHRISYACYKPLWISPTGGGLTVQIYLPAARLAIEYWGYPDGESGVDYVKQKMLRVEQIQQSDLSLLEVRDHELTQLDTMLTRALLKLGIKAY